MANNAKILIVDDNVDSVELLRKRLRAEGYHTSEAYDGEQALRQVEEYQPDLILLDIIMPKINGYEVCRRLKNSEDTRHIPIIMLTVKKEIPDKVKGLDIGANDYIIKPFDYRELLAKVKSLSTVKVEVEERLERCYRHMETFYHISQRIAESTSLKEVLDFILNKIKEVVDYQYPLPLILNSNKDHFVPIMGYDSPSILGNKDQVISYLSSIREPQDIKDLKSKELPWVEAFDAFPSLTLIPIIKDKDVIGSVILASREPAFFPKEDIRFVYLVLSKTSGAIRRIVLQDGTLKDLHHQIKMFSGYGEIVGKSHKMQQLYQLISDISPTDATVLIQGESGTGKELVAQAIHLHSLRKERSFVVVNCSVYPQTLLESELFGHEKGAFTGALRRKLGRFERAHKGTVFLDEIGDMPPISQMKLLRVLQSHEIERLGGEETIRVDVRIIAATNKDLAKEVEKGDFREDLFYRLNVFPIFLPPLRERKSDIPLLVKHFLDKLNSQGTKKVRGVSPECMQMLMDYNWPGNVRELENTVEHSFILTKGDVISVKDLPIQFQRKGLPQVEEKITSFEENERVFLARILQECHWNKNLAAKRLRIGRTTLYRKLKKHSLNREIAVVPNVKQH